MLPFLPEYIPPDVDMNKVLADVRESGVSAPAGSDIAGLQKVVADADSRGINLKIVVIGTNPPIDTPLRDIAYEVGQVYPDSTVLAISPFWAGTYSRSIDRVTLETGQDVAKSGNPVLSSQNFLNEITTPHFPWTAWTILLVVLVAVAAVATRFLQVLARRDKTAPIAATDGPAD
jgi:hypothetical protein